MLLCVLLFGACAAAPERNPVPAEQVATAIVPGLPEARSWADEAPSWLDDWFALSPGSRAGEPTAVHGAAHHYLAVSGGGANGAFTAGLLKGWSEAGTRPEFTVVTGVSTGAIIAPFAFLGSEYDPVLEEIYTTLTTEDAIEQKSVLGILLGSSGVETEGLERNIERYFNDDVIAALAREHRRGRVLAVGTTNLDAARPVTWNLTRIAASGHADAAALIRKVILASAAVPVAFPPVRFEVEAGGESYDELHVDGGASSLVYLYPLEYDWRHVLERLDVPDRPSLYIVDNGHLHAEWDPVDPDIFNIALRSQVSLMNSTVNGDLYRLYLAACRDGMAYRLAYIPDDFTVVPQEPFDSAYMRALFERGYVEARAGMRWDPAPPGLRVRPGDACVDD